MHAPAAVVSVRRRTAVGIGTQPDSQRTHRVAEDVAVERIADVDWLDATDLGFLRERGSRRSLRAGSTLFTEGDEPHDLMVVESGCVKITTTAANGQELVLELVGAGELLGELSAIDGAPRSATAVALVDVELTMIPAERFLAFLQEHPATMGALLAVTIERLRAANRRQLEFTTSDAMGRVCARLDDLADRYGRTRGDAVLIELSITQTELAQWCGLSREAVVKALRKLRDLGWIDTSDGAIAIVDRVTLRQRGQL